MLDVSNGQSRLVTNEGKCSSPRWIGAGSEILWLKSGDKGLTELRVGDADTVGSSYIAGVVHAPLLDIELRSLDDDRIAIAIVGQATLNGSIYNKEDQPSKQSSAMLYDTVMVRHWDTYVTPNKNAIFHGVLQRAKAHITESKGRFHLGALTNILKGSSLESPIPPFGGADNFVTILHWCWIRCKRS